ncbi:hypothetical protein BDF14DRAFT_718693 [Spinellus fusiger]|nr:hypothetical protein BDF14DRAFT_718693 [Spinellus fusiger]
MRLQVKMKGIITLLMGITSGGFFFFLFLLCYCYYYTYENNLWPGALLSRVPLYTLPASSWLCTGLGREKVKKKEKRKRKASKENYCAIIHNDCTMTLSITTLYPCPIVHYHLYVLF